MKISMIEVESVKVIVAELGIVNYWTAVDLGLLTEEEGDQLEAAEDLANNKILGRAS